VPARILVVEDDPSIRRLFEFFLGKAGYDIVTVENGQVAIERLDAERFDLVVTDLALPKISGLQVIRRVKEMEYCPVVAMSAHWQNSPLLIEAEELGCDATLAKPFDPEQLARLIARLVGLPAD